MVGDQLTRRRFIGGSGALAGSSLLRISAPAVLALAETACTARDETSVFTTLTVAEARELDAITARILPTTDTPGAREAGVVYFFDTVFADHFASELNEFRAAHDNFQAGIKQQYSEDSMFSDLSDADQDAYLTENDRTPFFDRIQSLTITGFFAMSSYGGNKGNVGWKLIGFDGHGAAQSPFGYYDAEYMNGAQGDR